ncbi:LacI family DNA-binding transcriptional regulator [Mycetocola reblochoni]|uniref:LacI-family transcriptional regulator n=1 Tax=Mycetocola reblochoni REB411 TaxID=1255698 RepID=A0A1R4KCL2_9MICO|nr:LacI-family transcriptional regulator [Mycetocola reblochoni REB411]
MLAAAAELDFAPNTAARLLKRGVRTRTVGLVTGDLANPFYAWLAKGIERALRPQGMQLTIASSDEDPERERRLLDELIDRGVSAIIVVTTQPQRTVQDAAQRGIPVVFVDRAPIGADADAVVIDNAGGARRAAEHLVAHGHRRIGYIGDLPGLPTHTERLDGFREGLLGAGIGTAGLLLHEGAHDAASAERAARDMLALPEPPTALFGGNNLITVGCLGAIRADRPETALLGFDDFELAPALGISVVAADPVRMGEIAVELALRGGEARGHGAVRRVLPALLRARGSAEVAPA